MRQIVLIFAFVIFACSTNRQNIVLSDFELNGKKKNYLIEGRIPAYGDGKKDGCIVSPQISLKLDYNKKLVSGLVFDSNSKETLPGAHITIISKEGVFNIDADDSGNFKIENIPTLQTVIVEFISYRSLIANLP